MQNAYTRPLLLLFLAATMAMGAAAGCVRKSGTAEPMQGPYTTPNDRAVIIHKGDDDSRRYYRDDSGKLYYVDQGGALHVIERRTKVERGTGGLYYIIDDDNVNYYTDENGRLRYRDDSGREIFIEDSGPGKVIDPLPILRGESYPRLEQGRSLTYCNDTWRKCTNRCNERGLGNKRSCLENCDYEREQCLQPY